MGGNKTIFGINNSWLIPEVFENIFLFSIENLENKNYHNFTEFYDLHINLDSNGFKWIHEFMGSVAAPPSLSTLRFPARTFYH